LQKASLDALQGSRVFANDSLIDDLHTVRGEITWNDPHLIVRVSRLARDVMAEAKRTKPRRRPRLVRA
jgi:Holliday junction resolvase RusA-like endonuclease